MPFGMKILCGLWLIQVIITLSIFWKLIIYRDNLCNYETNLNNPALFILQDLTNDVLFTEGHNAHNHTTQIDPNSQHISGQLNV